MHILYRSSDIRKTITKLLRESKGRRLVISAFVGRGSELYLPKPRGIELICWPKAGSTNPDAVRELINRGVKVSFAQLVHIKLYWTSDKGAVVTSANLSTAALGSGGQLELGVFLRPGAVDIDRVLREVEARPVTDKSLRKLVREHHDHVKRNPRESTRTSHAPDFDHWFESHMREGWKFQEWDISNIRLSSKAKDWLRGEFGSTRCHSWMSIDRGDCSTNDWILRLRKTPKRLGAADWMFAHQVVTVPNAERKRLNEGFEAQVLQVGPSSRYDHPPFSVDGKRIQRAIKRAYRENGPSDSQPPLRFINAIHKYYKD